MQVTWRRALIGLSLLWGGTGLAQSSALPEIAIADSGVFTESVTTSRDGAVITATLRKGVIYRAEPGSLVARPWITMAAGTATRVMGVLADDRRNQLWACVYAPAVGDAKPKTRIETFDLKTGAARRAYAFDGDGCNDIAVAADGTAYASDFAGGRVLRLRPGEAAFTVWSADAQLASADGLVVLGDGSVLVNTFRTGKLFRLTAAGKDAPSVQPIATSRALVRPDGMRLIGANRLALVEGDGHLDEVILSGDRAEIRTVAEGLPVSTTSVAMIGPVAIVSICDFAALRGPDADAVKSSLRRIRFAVSAK